MADVINKQSLIDQINALTLDGDFSQTDVNYLMNWIIANGDMTGSPRDLIQIRRGNRENLPNLAQGELGYTLDTKEFFVGGLEGNTPIGDYSSFGFSKKQTLTQQMIDDSYAKGILKLPAGIFNISSLTISQPLTIEGNSLKNTVIIVANTPNNIGFKVLTNWINFKNLTIKSNGSKADGNNVSGIVADKGVAGSIGYSVLESLGIQHFSGSGIKYVNAIDVTMRKLNTFNNAIGTEFTNGYGTSGSTTINSSDLYSSNDTVGIKLNKTTTSVFTRPIFEWCDYGIDALSSIFTINSPYYESVNINDIRGVDAIITRMGDGRNDKGNDISWVSQGSTSRAGNEFTRYDAITQKLTLYQVRGLKEKIITPYQYIEGGDNRNTGGMIFDSNRVIPFVAAHNLLKPDSWNYPFDPSRKGIKFFRPTVDDPSHCEQTLNLPVGSYEFISGIETGGSIGLSQIDTFSVVNADNGSVVYSYSTDPLLQQTDERLQMINVRFSISTTGNYKIRLYSVSSPMTVWMFGACLYQTNRVVSPNTSYDEAMRNAFILLDHVSNIKGGYNVLGNGKKQLYGVAPPTTGSYKIGDRMENTVPVANGYMGWVCVQEGAPGIWKGYGLIQT